VLFTVQVKAVDTVPTLLIVRQDLIFVFLAAEMPVSFDIEEDNLFPPHVDGFLSSYDGSKIESISSENS
jgi:hypothetical protein